MRVKVSFEVDVPTEKTNNEQIQEWLEFELGARGGMCGANPLGMTDIDADNVQYEEA